MGKKVKGGNPKLILQQVSTKLEDRHFSEAAAMLRKVKFPPKEKKEADQLNINIHYFWALDAFKNNDYLQAITTLRMFVERFKKKINLPLEKANILLGLCYFYNQDFGKATDYLMTAKNNPATQSFYFYYLLALVYKKKYTNIATLLNDHEKEQAFLNPNQKTYLEIAIAIVQADFTKAQKLLAGFVPKNKTIASNIASLQAILRDTDYSDSVKKIKPLYKSFLSLTLSDSEKKYLSKIPAFNQQVEHLKNNQLQTDLVKPLERLCEKGLSLTKKDFERCLGLPEKYRPYIVYNQVTALFNEDIEETELEIVAILKKYDWYFFQVPEAVFLFVQIVYWNPENFTTVFFWKNIETSLDRFGKTFSNLQLNRLSWRLVGCLDDHGFSEGKTSDRRQNKLVKNYPQMLGLKWRQLTEYLLAPKTGLLESALDLFTFPNFQYGGHIAKSKWEDFLDMMYPDPAIISMMFNRVLMDDDYLPVGESMIEEGMNNAYMISLTKAQSVLIRATTEYTVHLKNKVVLDFFKLTNQYIQKFEKEKKLILDKQLKTHFFEAYHKMIVFFEEDTSNSDYLQDYQTFEQAPKINRLAKILEEDEAGKDTVELLQEYLEKGESNIIHQVLLDELRFTTFIENALHKVSTYLNILIIEGGKEPLADVVERFANSYIKRLRLPYVPNYPDSNFFDILERLIKAGTTPNHILTISILVERYMLFLTRVVEPMYYNMAEKILSYFLKAKKKQPNFDFNLAIIQELKDFIKKAVIEKKLKKLGATLANAEKVFP